MYFKSVPAAEVVCGSSQSLKAPSEIILKNYTMTAAFHSFFIDTRVTNSDI